MRLSIEKPGMFTTVQDLGRYGYQLQGVPVAGAMDGPALRLGNILLGNHEGAAALEITVLGPTLEVAEGEGCIVVTGADAGLTRNGEVLESWRVHRVRAGDALAFSAPSAGSRAYLCVSGGIDVPVVMGSRSTYVRGRFGGHEGRPLKAGDSLRTGTPDVLWADSEGLQLPFALRPRRDPEAPLRVVPGPQDDAFTPVGLRTFLSAEYAISASADRMGYRMEGPVVEHVAGPDIVSDAIVLGSVQVPGHGQPIVMLADRQTTGGYTKIATVCAVDIPVLAQRLPGQKARFSRISLSQALDLLRDEARLYEEARLLRAAWRARPGPAPCAPSGGPAPCALGGRLRVAVDGTVHTVEWERMD